MWTCTCLAPSPSGRAGRPAPRSRPSARPPHCRAAGLAPSTPRPRPRPPRCDAPPCPAARLRALLPVAAPRSRAQPRPCARLSCTRAAAPWLRARGARRTRRRQRGPEQPRGEVLRPHHGRHRPPRQDLSTGQPIEVVIIDDDDEAAALPSPTPAVVEAEASDVVVDADTVEPSRLPSRWRVRSRAAAPATQQRCSRSRMVPTTASHPAPTSAVAPPPGQARQEIFSSVIRPVSRRWGVSAGLRSGSGIEVTREFVDLFISSSRSPLSTRFDQGIRHSMPCFAYLHICFSRLASTPSVPKYLSF
nr:serine/arginine repetitive matrix protein 1-like [Aegilops tauschii subsp. strangulata]